jgi:hypothetical protein
VDKEDEVGGLELDQDEGADDQEVSDDVVEGGAIVVLGGFSWVGVGVGVVLVVTGVFGVELSSMKCHSP